MISPKPGPTFPIADAAPEIAVIKSNPNPPKRQAITAKEIIYKKRTPSLTQQHFLVLAFDYNMKQLLHEV